MALNKLVLVVVAIGIVGLSVVYLFDPSKNFPKIALDATLEPGQNLTIHIPPFNVLQFAVNLFTNPYYWIHVTAEGLMLENYTLSLIPNEMRGLIPIDEEGRLCIYNPTDNPISSVITGMRAPDPSQIGKATMSGYFIVGVIDIIVASIIAAIKPTPTVHIRPPADKSLGQVAGQLRVTGKCATIRDFVVWLIGGCCLRRTRGKLAGMV